MAPRNHPLPEATTESAREARKSFFCELCQKGYARMNEFEAHEGSYDHQHRKRLKEMRHLTKPPNFAAAARASEAKANEEAGLKSISLSSLQPSSSNPSSSKKKPVFRSTLEPHNAAALGVSESKSDVLDDEDPSGAVVNGWEDERYDPRFVSGCEDVGCKVCRDGRIDLGPCDGEVEMRD